MVVSIRLILLYLSNINMTRREGFLSPFLPTNRLSTFALPSKNSLPHIFLLNNKTNKNIPTFFTNNQSTQTSLKREERSLQ
uniref:Ovule protein n=1 Tax=Meloidogyne incognita TaxID=6306 RepID=A0A914LAR7_MELIC